METISKKTVHVGRNIQKFRILRGYSQGGLAGMLEEKRKKPVSQQLISDIEDRAVITDEELLQQIAEVLNVTPDILKTWDIDAAINIYSNTFDGHSVGGQQINYHPIDKVVEIYEKQKAELKELYETQKAELKEEIKELRREIEQLKYGK